jgi:predicted Rossmann fold flavoprotein
VPPTPALAPLLLDGDTHRRLQGVTHVVELVVEAEGAERTRLKGSMLWTHFGISGPVVLNASRLWHRADLEGRRVTMSANLVDGRSFEDVESLLLEGPRRPSVRAAIQRLMPAAVADAVLDAVMLDGATSLGALTREDRRRLVHALTAWRLPVTGSRGYGFAEATAGGVELTEVDVARMESRCAPGLFLAGEVLDVDGRIGGFNFQWAWSTGHVVGRALAARS